MDAEQTIAEIEWLERNLLVAVEISDYTQNPGTSAKDE
jgi:hypothetical protein